MSPDERTDDFLTIELNWDIEFPEAELDYETTPLPGGYF